ncbi:amidase family protein [Paenibacillus lemnae]|uniref:Amidase n=1 Tax=Paenibacillus lemnae TaxID=1330551 RepID=A0A848M136_PAELE|nr:amidase family protein [Paenibacillus lemnae]NMO94475.1 amidase [Paenibacillus lemnae]
MNKTGISRIGKRMFAAMLASGLLFTASPWTSYADVETASTVTAANQAAAVSLSSTDETLRFTETKKVMKGTPYKVSISSATDLDSAAGKFVVDYDASLFDFDSAEPVDPSIRVVGTREQNGKLTLVTMQSNGAVKAGQPVFTLTFNPKRAAAGSQFKAAAEMALPSGGTIEPSQGTVLGIKGDLTGDNIVDIQDLSLLSAHNGATSASGDWEQIKAADFNGDGAIRLYDLTAMGNIIAFQSGSSVDLAELSVREIQNTMEAGTLTAVELVTGYLERIAKYDKQGPSINSMITINSDALRIASLLDAERMHSGSRGLMHGIPVIVKDNYNTIGMPTSAGCTCLKDNYTLTDAQMVEQLRDGGAIILGKANLHEFALGLSTVSSLGGQTLNPYDLTKNPGGSSGGTGAAIAANFAVLGLGTDTGGSIRIPSSYNNLVGLRPTIGLTSREGIVPLALSQDTGGPMARTVEDIAISMDYLKGYDPDDAATLYSMGRTPKTYTDSLDKDGLNGARIGVIRDPLVMGTNEGVIGLTNQAIDDMKAAGATVVDVEVPNLSDILAYPSLSSFEFKSDLNTYFETYINNNPDTKVPYRSLSDIVDSVTDMLPHMLNVYKGRDSVTDLSENQDYRDIILKRPKLTREALLQTMTDNQLDALLYPSTANPPANLRDSNAGSANRLSPYSGFPAISIPAGFVTGGTEEKLPQNIELLGRPFDEAALIKLAYSYEQHTQHREAPVHVPAVKKPVELPQFTDVPSTHWAYDTIRTLAAQQIVQGTGGSLFMPKRTVTRAEFTSMLVRALKLEAAGSADFSDVPAGAWYAGDVSKAAGAGIVNGRSATSFAPNDSITREEVVIMLVKAYELHYQTTLSPAAPSFKDQAAISSWASEFVGKAQKSGLVQGTPSGLFSPKSEANRAEAAQFIANLLD